MRQRAYDIVAVEEVAQATAELRSLCAVAEALAHVVGQTVRVGRSANRCPPTERLGVSNTASFSAQTGTCSCSPQALSRVRTGGSGLSETGLIEPGGGALGCSVPGNLDETANVPAQTAPRGVPTAQQPTRRRYGRYTLRSAPGSAHPRPSGAGGAPAWLSRQRIPLQALLVEPDRTGLTPRLVRGRQAHRASGRPR